VTNSEYSDFMLTWAASAKSRKRKNATPASDAEFLPKFGPIVTCFRAEPSQGIY